MGVNAYFGRKCTNIPHASPNYEPGKYKLDVDYYM